MNRSKYIDAGIGLMISAAMTLAGGVAMTVMPAPQAQAVSYSEYQQKVANHKNLKAQLAGVDQELADKIIQLDSLTNDQIPAAKEAANKAQQAAQQAQDLADATAERLEAAKKDKADLEEKIKQTGAEYDDAKDSVAEMARNSFHGSDASAVMEVVTNATTADDFVAQMQSEAAATRSAANAANSAATSLNTSMNRKERLAAIEDQIAKLKTQADEQAASAKKASQDAADKQSSLETLQAQVSSSRQELEQRKSSLTTQAAKEAADILSIESELAAQNWGNSGNVSSGSANQQKPSGGSSGGSSSGGSSSGGSSSGGSSSGGSSSGGSGGASGMNYAVPGNCPEGSRFCYGHNTGNTVGGSAYPSRQCTLWAYIRRSQLSLPVGSYMGNGAEWGAKGRALGYYVNNTPHVGAAMVFARGQRVTSWYANRLYGHVAVVERVNSDGSLLISEGGTGFATFPAWETVWPNGNEFVHY